MGDIAIVGVANHTGWAHFVTVAFADEEVVVIDRRRVQLLDESLPNQPYAPQAGDLLRPDAQALVAEVRRSAGAYARTALATLAAELEPAHVLAAVAMRGSTFGVLPADVSEVLDYRPFKYAADGMLYLEVLHEAAEALGFVVARHAKGHEFELAGARLGMDANDVEAWLKEFGVRLGPPWTQEHLRAAAAAIAMLPDV
ncbi:MAG TPA: hypothetical protein VGI95_07815 [Caulobacteraceae bacterium]|jgi:hypothetical protein